MVTLRSTTATVAFTLLLPVDAQAAQRCEDVLGKSDATAAQIVQSNPLPAACGQGIACTSKCRQGKDARYEVVGSFDGGFLCSGKRERIVSLFPCNDAAGMHGVAGRIVLLQATPRGWRKVGEHGGDAFANSDCAVHSAAGRDIVVCKAGWGPYQGVTGTSVCVISASVGAPTVMCPLRVSSQDDDTPEIGAVRVVAGGRPDQAVLDVEVAGRHLSLELDARGVRASPRTQAELKDKPIDGLELNDE